jgi:hypothetical protein
MACRLDAALLLDDEIRAARNQARAGAGRAKRFKRRSEGRRPGGRVPHHTSVRRGDFSAFSTAF